MDRFFAIICSNENNNVSQILSNINSDKVVIFYTSEEYISTIDKEKYEVVQIPAEKDNQAKIKNFAIKYMKENHSGWLHLIEDTIEILKDPSQFISDIEKTLDVFGLNSFFSTITDICNYVFQKYNPRLTITMDSDEFKDLGLPNISFTSNANTQWIVINTSKADDNEMYFDEQYSVAMFYIIEFLARRKATHPNSLYYMNQYLTVESEKGVFVNKTLNQSDKQTSQDVLEKENKIFRSSNINTVPDNNIDQVLERVYETLKKRLS